MLRLITAISVISLSGVLPWESWPIHLLLMAVMWGAAVCCGARSNAMWKRLAVFLPFVLCVCVGVPFTHAEGWSWAWPVTILCRSLVAFFVGIWLVQALPFTELLQVLRQLHIPEVFVTSLAFMQRYLVVLWEELARMKTARRARCGQLTWLRTWVTSAQMIGELLLRAWDRAERVHRAMLARGGASVEGSTP